MNDNKSNTRSIAIDIWGDFACFTRPEHKIERVSYDVPTPSALRGVLNAIYFKPSEFYYEIVGFDVMRTPKTIDIQKIEVYKKADSEQINTPLVANEIRTMRHTVYLKDVYYRVYANMHKRQDATDVHVTIESIISQFNRRVKRGQCFYQPFLGTKECMCFFGETDDNQKPIELSMNLGVMLYDIFNIDNNTPLITGKNGNEDSVVNYSFYHPYMINGHVDVPAYHSGEIIRRQN